MISKHRKVRFVVAYVPKLRSPIGKFHSIDMSSAQIVISVRNAIRNVLREKEEVGVPIASMNISRDRLRGGRVLKTGKLPLRSRKILNLLSGLKIWNR